MKLLNNNNNNNNNKGFTLLEVLVAIVIVSIGLLAVAGMQTTAITGNASAKDATTAIQFAEEMADRIRVNAGDTPEIYNCADTNYDTQAAVSTATSCTAANSGKPSDATAQGDYNQWRARLQDTSLGLSGARGQVVVTKDSPISKTATITVTVTWGSITIRTVRFITIMETWLT